MAAKRKAEDETIEHTMPSGTVVHAGAEIIEKLKGHTERRATGRRTSDPKDDK